MRLFDKIKGGGSEVASFTEPNFVFLIELQEKNLREYVIGSKFGLSTIQLLSSRNLEVVSGLQMIINIEPPFLNCSYMNYFYG